MSRFQPFSKYGTTLKLTVIGATAGVAIFLALTSYFRRRKKHRKYPEPQSRDDDTFVIVNPEMPQWHSRDSQASSMSGKGRWRGTSPRVSASPACAAGDAGLNIPRSLSSSRSSVNTLICQDLSTLSCGQLCQMGLEALVQAIEYWEEGVARLETDAGDMSPLQPPCQQLRHLLECARRIQEVYEAQISTPVAANLALDSALSTLAEYDFDDNLSWHRSRSASVADSSDVESFVSAAEASDVANLADLEEYRSQFGLLPLYESALLELENGSIPYRMLRTSVVACRGDAEYLAKLHCVRLALSHLLSDPTNREWFAESSKEMFSMLLMLADQDCEGFEMSFDELMMYVNNPENWASMEEELSGRGVKVMTFFDIVFDFIIFDAFDDLDNPPSSVRTVVQNRWLSNGFKETALSTAVWSVIKAKRRLLKVPKGFISHFYSVSEHISPVLAWGLLGPKSPFSVLCWTFKEQVVGFMQDVFSLVRVRYTTVEQLSDDILALSRERFARMRHDLNSRLQAMIQAS